MTAHTPNRCHLKTVELHESNGDGTASGAYIHKELVSATTLHQFPPNQPRHAPVLFEQPRSNGRSIMHLPYEIVSYIAQELPLETVYDLAQTCRHFEYLIREENLCKMLLSTKARYTMEMEDAVQDGSYARAFRRLMKRRRAVSQGSPFAVSILGVADSFALHSGKLLYLVGDPLKRNLRILDLQRATNQELVVCVSKLVAEAVPASEGCRKYIFRILNHASGITTCLYSYARPTTQSWLLIFNAQEHRLIGTVSLASTIRLFVRNNNEHLIFGTHSEYDAQGNRKWVLRYYSLQSQYLREDKLHMSNLVGYEIGSSVCFEIFDNYFYGCSNQTSFELEEIDWTSYYYCFRFPLDDFSAEKTDVMCKRDAFRRQHIEGPIDDRWTFLSLNRDEESGSIRIVECRREWLNGTSENRRTYYDQEVRFRRDILAGNGTGSVGDTRDGNDPLPDDQLVGLLRSGDRPNYLESPIRALQGCHAGDFGPAMFSRNKTYLSTYSLSCKTFMDLVDDPLPNEAYTQRLRIRTGLKTFHVQATPHSPQEYRCDNKEAMETARGNVISCWPPDPALAKSAAQAEISQQLGQVMNPKDLCGSVTASYDGRSIVYSTGDGTASAPKVLICVTFDPAVRISGMVHAGCLHAETTIEEGESLKYQNNARLQQGEQRTHQGSDQWPCYKDIAARVPDGVICPLPYVPWSAEQDLQSNPTLPGEGKSLWVRIEDAMHQRFLGKYVFGFNKAPQA